MTLSPEINTPREIWPDILRIISVIAVILLHAGGAGFFFFGPRSADWQVCSFYDGIARFGVPCFVMLSGMFILDPAREYPLKKLFLQKILRIAAAFVFWSAFYSLFAAIEIFSYEKDVSISYFFAVFAKGFFNGYYHLWFLGMISGLYIITPFLRVIVKDEKLTRYFLMLSLIFVFAGNVLQRLPATAAGNLLCTLSETLEVKFIAGYAGYFVWGYWLSAHKLSSRTRKIIYLLGIMGALVTAVGNGTIGYVLNRTGVWTFENLLPNIFLMATAVFVFCQYNFKAERFPEERRK